MPCKAYFLSYIGTIDPLCREFWSSWDSRGLQSTIPFWSLQMIFPVQGRRASCYIMWPATTFGESIWDINVKGFMWTCRKKNKIKKDWKDIFSEILPYLKIFFFLQFFLFLFFLVTTNDLYYCYNSVIFLGIYACAYTCLLHENTLPICSFIEYLLTHKSFFLI